MPGEPRVVAAVRPAASAVRLFCVKNMIFVLFIVFIVMRSFKQLLFNDIFVCRGVLGGLEALGSGSSPPWDGDPPGVPLSLSPARRSPPGVRRPETPRPPGPFRSFPPTPEDFRGLDRTA